MPSLSRRRTVDSEICSRAHSCWRVSACSILPPTKDPARGRAHSIPAPSRSGRRRCGRSWCSFAIAVEKGSDPFHCVFNPFAGGSLRGSPYFVGKVVTHLHRLGGLRGGVERH